MVKFSFNYKGKYFNIDVKECRSVFYKASGLMFRAKSKALLFVFDKPVKKSIHSFFCLPFVAIWFNGSRIVDAQLIKPWKINIKPSKKFDKFLEIPSNCSEFNSFRLLITK